LALTLPSFSVNAKVFLEFLKRLMVGVTA